MMSSTLPWIKLYIDILDDPFIGVLPASTRWRFIELLALAGICDAEGYLVDGEKPFTVQTLAWRLRCPSEELSTDLEMLDAAGLVIQDGESFLIPSFSMRQGRTQEEKRLQWRERQRRHRLSKAGGESEPDSEPVDGYGDAPNGESDQVGSDTSATPGGYGNPPYNELGGEKGRLHDAAPVSVSTRAAVPVTGDMRDRGHAGVPCVTLPEGNPYSKGNQNKKYEESHHHDAGAGGNSQALPAQMLPASPTREQYQGPGSDLQPEGGKTVNPRPGQAKEDDDGEARGLNPVGNSLKADSQVMRMTNSSPIDHYCKLFNCQSLNSAQRNALLKLEAAYGAAQLCKVISWAAEKDIPPNRAIVSIRSAIRAWKDGPDLPRSPAASSHKKDSTNRYDQYKG